MGRGPTQKVLVNHLCCYWSPILLARFLFERTHSFSSWLRCSKIILECSWLMPLFSWFKLIKVILWVLYYVSHALASNTHLLSWRNSCVWVLIDLSWIYGKLIFNCFKKWHSGNPVLWHKKRSCLLFCTSWIIQDIHTSP